MIRKILLILIILAVCNASDLEKTIDVDTEVSGPGPADGTARKPYIDVSTMQTVLGPVLGYDSSNDDVVACQMGYTLCEGEFGLTCIHNSLAKENKEKKLVFSEQRQNDAVGAIEVGKCRIPGEKEDEGPGILYYTLHFSLLPTNQGSKKLEVVEKYIEDVAKGIEDGYYCLAVDENKQESKLFECSDIKGWYIHYYSTLNPPFSLEFQLPTYNASTKRLQYSPDKNHVKLYCGDKKFIEEALNSEDSSPLKTRPPKRTRKKSTKTEDFPWFNVLKVIFVLGGICIILYVHFNFEVEAEPELDYDV